MLIPEERAVRIKSFSTNAGFLEQARVEFAPGLTCIIGARGTCKSTLVETIRFVFNVGSAERLKKHMEPGGLIEVTLGGGTAKCELEVTAADSMDSVVLERERGDVTRIFHEGVRELANRDLLNQIDIFSQGDLQRVADRDDLRLQLIDRAHWDVISELCERRRVLTGELLRIGEELRVVRAKISSLKQEVQPLEDLRNHLAVTIADAPEIPPELEIQRQLFQKRLTFLESLDQAITLQEQAIAQLQPVREIIDALRVGAGPLSDQQLTGSPSLGDSIRQLIENLANIQALSGTVEGIDLRAQRQLLGSEFDQQNETYYALRREQQHVNDSLKKQQMLQQQIEHLERIQSDLNSKQERESDLHATRQRTRDEIAIIDSQVFDRRIVEIERINTHHGDRVFLALQTGPGSDAYIKTLSTLLNGSRIRNQPEVASDLARTFPPSDLIDIVESGSGQEISQILGRDLGQMNRVVAHLSDHLELYKLEAELPDARLEITFYDGDEPKPVETLSKGQKATALLPLILRPMPYPLLIDQPEDDLDNSFIFHSLVQTVRELKNHRQIIFVTHNANIPVLGEADRVIVMEMDTPTRASVPLQGNVDKCKPEILELLEGGQEAFLEREAWYRDILG
jgi:hypothetical protein